MFQRILKCDFEFVEPWWDDVSLSAKVTKIDFTPSHCILVNLSCCKILKIKGKFIKKFAHRF